MAQAKSISLSQFTTAVQSAVKTAAQKHKLKVDPPQEVSFSYIIKGFPIPPTLLANVSFSEVQSFADDVATAITAQPGFAADAALGAKGAVYSGGGHLIIGIPAVDQFSLKQ
jgi:hypothetical protein